MIFLQRRRLFFWLLKAYFKKWRKTILISFAVGLIVFFLLKFVVNYFIPLIPFTQQQTIGMVGAYTIDTLPSDILTKISKGLVYADKNDLPKPDLAKSWEVKNSGKTYIFHLKDNLKFSDGTEFTSDEINYSFSDVDVQRPNKDTIIFNLKSSYSPFLLTVSRPVFKDGFVGIGDYKVQSVNINGSFVQSISLVSLKDRAKEIIYQFYPTEEALKTAYALGNVTEITGVRDLSFNGASLADYKNTTITKSVDDSKLVTIFYNTQDKDLSDKRLREALAYAMPDTFIQGQRNYGPFQPNSWINQTGLTTYSQDFEHAKLLLGACASSATISTTVPSSISTSIGPRSSTRASDGQRRQGRVRCPKYVCVLPLDFRQRFLRNIEIRRHVLHVVVVVELFHQLAAPCGPSRRPGRSSIGDAA